MNRAIYFSREHCKQLGIEYSKSYAFYMRVEKIILLRPSWDGPHTELFEKIINDFGLGSEIEMKRTLHLPVEPPGWYKVIGVAGHKKTWREES